MKKAYLICAINPLSYQYPKTVFLFLCENKTHPLRAVSSQLFRLCPPKAVIILNDSMHRRTKKSVRWNVKISGAVQTYLMHIGSKTSIPHFRQVQAVYNATGVWVNELPITPEKILKGMHVI